MPELSGAELFVSSLTQFFPFSIPHKNKSKEKNKNKKKELS